MSWRRFARNRGRPSSSGPASRGPSRACSASCASMSRRSSALVDQSRDEFLWVIDFPLFELDEETGGGRRPPSVHRIGRGTRSASRAILRGAEPGLRPRLERRRARLGLDPDSSPGRAGARLPRARPRRGGSQGEVRLPARSAAEGAPPHGGIALGLDRFVALLAGEPNIREVIAFPKVSSGADPLTGAPAPVPADQLEELGIRVVEKPA